MSVINKLEALQNTVNAITSVARHELRDAYKQGRADAIEELKSKADCKNSDCYACAMADGNMNCMIGLLELEE